VSSNLKLSRRLNSIKSSRAHSRGNWLQKETDVSGTISVPPSLGLWCDWRPRVFPLYTCPGTVLMAGPEPIGASGRYIEGTLGVSSHITTLMMGTEIVPETSVSFSNQFTRLCAREDFIEMSSFVYFCGFKQISIYSMRFKIYTSGCSMPSNFFVLCSPAQQQ
jgi:hypothetical protein